MSFPTDAALQKANFRFIQHTNSWNFDLPDKKKGASVVLTRTNDGKISIIHYGLHEEDDWHGDGEADEAIVASFKGRLRSDDEFELLLWQLEIT